jgi:hypothetical protein
MIPGRKPLDCVEGDGDLPSTTSKAPEAPAAAEEKMAQHSASAEEKDERESGLEELGTLVLRVWREPQSADGVRIRILASDGAWEPADVSVTADRAAAVKSVSDWLAVRASGERRESGSTHPM